MALSLSISSVMWFRVSGHHKTVCFPTIFVNYIPLNATFKQKYLGLIFDDTLSWSHQVSKVCRSISYYLYLLNKQRKIFKTDLFKLLFESLVFVLFASLWSISQ